jgi:uncharacterized protein (DUF2267 family)
MRTHHHIDAIETTVHATHLWLNEICERIGWQDRYRAYHALRAFLHALRDHLSIDEVVSLGAQLPMLIRGLYFEGWTPADKPVRDRTEHAFLERIRTDFQDEPAAELPRIVRGVFAVISKHVSKGQSQSVLDVLPEHVRGLLRK